MQQQFQCPNCGSQVAFGARFCGNCGALLAIETKEKRGGTAPWLIVLVIFVAVAFMACGLLLALGKSETQPDGTSIDTSNLSSSLLIYLDENYTELWDATNMPDLSNLVWSASPSQGPGWETGTLIVFLQNTGTTPIKVNVTDYESLSAVPAGFSVSSDTIVLEPNEYRSLAITIHVSPTVRSMLYQNEDIVSIYFHVYPAN